METLVDTYAQGPITAVAANGNELFFAVQPTSGDAGGIFRVSRTGLESNVVCQIDPQLDHVGVSTMAVDTDHHAVDYGS